MSALALAGCTEADYQNMAGSNAKANAHLPPHIIKVMSSKRMSRTSPVMARIFKEEGKLEVWKQKDNGRYDIIASYDICKFSGKLGPKFVEGDRQAPEGFYTVRPAQMNPNSKFHLSFNIGYPNAYDRANGRTGAHLMVHGDCSSSGCYSMNNGPMEEIYAFARDAFQGGQTEFQIQAFPFRMTAANMKRYRSDPNYAFWEMLKEGYDHFEITKVPPKVDVCEKRYVFNRLAGEGQTFDPMGACPMTTQPEPLAAAYQSHRAKYQSELEATASMALDDPKPSIVGIQEAGMVSEWTKRRARGERVPVEPPTMTQDGAVLVTSPMGRANNEAGRKMAALEAAQEAKRREEADRAAEKAAKEAEKAAAKAAAALAKAQADAPKTEPESAAIVPPPDESRFGGVRKKITNLFGS
jgi:murein L,D-transpeptidase YafK